MDQTTHLLAGLAAAVAANCPPCFEHYFYQGRQAGLSPEDLREAAELGEQMKRGASLSMKASMADITSEIQSSAGPCDCTADDSCCS